MSKIKINIKKRLYFFIYILNIGFFVNSGAGGFEPTNGGVKNRCLATWRRPIFINGYTCYILIFFLFFVNFFYVSEREGFEPSVQIICTTD